MPKFNLITEVATWYADIYGFHWKYYIRVNILAFLPNLDKKPKVEHQDNVKSMTLF